MRQPSDWVVWCYNFFPGPERTQMAKRGQAVRRSPTRSKAPTKRQRVTAGVDLKKEIATLRLELAEALERQTATSEVLQVISSTPGDLQPVFQSLLKNATRVCGAKFGTMNLFEWNNIRLVALHNVPPAYADALGQSRTFRPHPKSGLGQVIRTKRVTHLADLRTSPAYLEGSPASVALSNLAGARTLVIVPMLKDAKLVGTIGVYRQEVRPFTDKQIELLSNFAKQAVIAIENTRLLRELRESLQQQTATADVLKVISRSAFDLQPVFDTIVQTASRLCDAEYAIIYKLRDDDKYHVAANNGADPVFLKYAIEHPLAPGRGSLVGRTALERKTVHMPDCLADPEYVALEFQSAGRYRSILGVPLLREGVPIGVIILMRTVVLPFTEKQIELVTTFADQAVIAIENARLFDEVQAKTHELSEALTYQTGSSKILSVIASSPTDVAPVLKAIVESACELCEAYDAVVRLRDGDDLRLSAHHGSIPTSVARLPIDRNVTAGRAFLDKKPVHVHDLLSAEGDQFPKAKEMSRLEGGHRTVLSVPLLREGESIGAIVLRRIEVHPFSEKQIGLLQTFADQAVIALGNVRLFEEVQARTEDLRESLEFQTATSDVLKVISSSPDSLQPVLDVIVDTARHLCGTEASTIFLLRDEKFHIAAASGARPDYMEFLQKNPIALNQAGSSTSRAAREKRTVHIPDIGADPEFGQGPMAVGQRRALLSVPLMREGTAIGVITMRQSHLTPFTERQIEVVQTFADQAVIAISNVRLFEEVQARTRDLSHSLNELRTAQDRLVQTEKLASLGQLTAGIAHEIKNPLNFVNNFSALSAELTDELNDVLKSATLADKVRVEVDELTGLLKDNLQKVVQHGKRADSIVKNMLLHSREGSGERGPADINALLDESLNLAYHGARAEKPQFNVTLQRDFDENAGTLDLFPQEITRAFLNLISNGFYAATRRKLENDDAGFEPVLVAMTRNLGDTVEIRIRDNGTGIPAEVREKMFNPFFTTKPAGEGTGLGLSMSHDIIVKQHGGRIDVETEPGQFTEFTIVLPRTSNLSKQN